MYFCRSIALTVGLAVVTSAPISPIARAQESQTPVAKVSLAPLERLLKDTEYLLTACDQPDMWRFINFMSTPYLQGIDRTKPIGVSVTMNGPMPSAAIFLPMTDRKAFFGAIGGMGIVPDDLGDGLFEINTPGQIIYAKASKGGDWLYVAQTEQDLANIPDNPGSILGTLPTKYDIAVEINVQALPQEVKDMASEQMRIGFENGLAGQSGQTAEERAFAEKVGQAQLAQIEQLLAETERVILGWSVDSPNQMIYLDAAAQFVAGSKLADQVDASKDMTSDYTAFQLPYPAANFRFSSEIIESDRELVTQNFRNSMMQVDGMLDKQDLPPEAREIISTLIDGLASITEKTIAEGKFDGAGSVNVGDDTLRILMGGRIADGTALAAEFKKLAANLPKDPKAPKFEFDYGTHKGIALHRITVPVKIADPGAKKIFGDSLLLTVGTGPKSFMLALDPAGDASLKTAIDAMQGSMGKQVSPFESVVRLEQLLQFAQAISPNSMVDNAVQTIGQYSGKDTVQITGRIIERGGVYRISVDEGVLHAVGAAAKGGGNGGF